MAAIHLHSNHEQLDVVVNLNVPISITINTTNLTYSFTKEEATSLLNDTRNIPIGTFDIRVSFSTNTDFNVYSFAESKYINDFHHFQVLIKNDHDHPCEMLFYSNKNAFGTDGSTEVVHLTPLISHLGSNPQNTIHRTITAYLTPGHMKHLENRSATLSLFFKVVGA